MKRITTSTTIWEHLLPFLLLLLLVNGYLAFNLTLLWETLQTGGFSSVQTTNLILVAFMGINLCALLGYLLSRLCFLAGRLIFLVVRQVG